MKREIIEIDKCILARLIGKERDDWEEENNIIIDEQELNKYEFIEEKIRNVDEYDGGADYEAIIKRKSDDRFYKLTYQEWDIDWEKGDFNNFPEELIEVYPKQITKTIYE